MSRRRRTLPRKPIPNNPIPDKHKHQKKRLSSFVGSLLSPVRMVSPESGKSIPRVKEQHPVEIVFLTILLLVAVGVFFFVRTIVEENAKNRPNNTLIYTDGTIDSDNEEMIGTLKRSEDAVKVANQYNEVQRQMDSPDPETVK